ncbi:unnamed protein product, partial [Aphanomyces euteiches]
MSHRLPQVTRLVLQVPELLRCIMQFKQGIYTDMLPLRYLAMPLTSNSADVFPSDMATTECYVSSIASPDCGVYRGILPVVQLLASEYDLQ